MKMVQRLADSSAAAAAVPRRVWEFRLCRYSLHNPRRPRVHLSLQIRQSIQRGSYI
jgi:hypothetical protein